jgi:hypothetical protein
MNKTDFNTFYALYMTSHQNRWNRRVHLLGWLLGSAQAAWALVSGQYWVIVLAPVPALMAIWVGHQILEPGADIEFKHPFLTAFANLRMFGQMLTGRIPF